MRLGRRPPYLAAQAEAAALWRRASVPELARFLGHSLQRGGLHEPSRIPSRRRHSCSRSSAPRSSAIPGAPDGNTELPSQYER
jgi:hypothetical protein